MVNERILEFIKFGVDNNQVALANSMFDEKVTVREGENIVSRLYKLFENNRTKFINVFRDAGYNDKAENYTTDPSVLRKMSNELNVYKNAGQPTQETSREAVDTSTAREWYDAVLDTLVGGGKTTGTGTTTITEPAVGTQTKIIMVSVLAVGGIVALVYFLTR